MSNFKGFVFKHLSVSVLYCSSNRWHLRPQQIRKKGLVCLYDVKSLYTLHLLILRQMETDFQTELWHRIQCSSWQKTPQHALPLDSKNLSVCIRSKICAVARGRGRGLDAAAQNKLTYTELFGGEEEDSFSINDSSSLITESLWLKYPFLCLFFW